MLVLFFADCESLVRKVLVRDPDRRYTIAQIKRHSWMQVEVPEEEKKDRTVTDDDKPVKRGRRGDQPTNEAILKIMADLGIDTSVTREVIKGAVALSNMLVRLKFFRSQMTLNKLAQQRCYRYRLQYFRVLSTS